MTKQVSLNIGIIFNDDSTLYLALKLGELLSETIHRIVFFYVELADKPNALSERQLSLVPSSFSLSRIGEKELAGVLKESVSTVFVGKSFPTLDAYLSTRPFRNQAPYFVSFLTGIDLTPERGALNRRLFDHVFLGTEKHASRFRHLFDQSRTTVSWGHPSFLMPTQFRDPKRGDILVFPQAISPRTTVSRNFMAQVIIAAARANPDRRFLVKTRQIEGENSSHANRQETAIEELLFRMGPSENVHFVSGRVEDHLMSASISFSACSSAGFDGLSYGVVPIFMTSFPEDYLDKLAGEMSRVLKGSGISENWEDFVSLSPTLPDRAWLEGRFRSKSDFLQELEAVIAKNE